MNRRDLPHNFVDDPEAIIRKTRAKLNKVRSSTLERKAPSNQEDLRSFIWNLTSEFEAMANKLIRDFLIGTDMESILGWPDLHDSRSKE